MLFFELLRSFILLKKRRLIKNLAGVILPTLSPNVKEYPSLIFEF